MKRVLAIILVLCLSMTLFVGCKNDEEVIVDDAITDGEAPQEIYLTLYAFGDEEQEYTMSVTVYETQEEYGMISMPATEGEKIGDILASNDYNNITPVESKGKFEGWMEYKEVATMDADGFEQYSYEKLSDETVYTTEELLERTMPEYGVMYVAKWDNLDDDYYASMGY